MAKPNALLHGDAKIANAIQNHASLPKRKVEMWEEGERGATKRCKKAGTLYIIIFHYCRPHVKVPTGKLQRALAR